MASWIYLILAIIFEVIGTLTMKYNAGGESAFISLGIMYIMLILSYSAFGLAIKHIPLAIAYGIWESLGLVLIAVCAALFFAEPMNLTKIIGIIAIITGIILLKVEIPKKDKSLKVY